jgi:hypothetical protein
MIGLATGVISNVGPRVLFDVFQSHGDHTGTSCFVAGMQLQEPSLALVAARDWLRTHLCDRLHIVILCTGGMQAKRFDIR